MYKANPNLSIKVERINASDFYRGDGTMVKMLRHTAKNPLDISSGMVGNLMIFDTQRIYEMAVHVRGTDYFEDFNKVSTILFNHNVDVVEILDNVPDPRIFKKGMSLEDYRIKLTPKDCGTAGEMPAGDNEKAFRHPSPTMSIVLQQDECAPDSYEYFCRGFKAMFGEEFVEWKKAAKRTVDDDGFEYRYTYGDLMVTISADHQFYTVWRTNTSSP